MGCFQSNWPVLFFPSVLFRFGQDPVEALAHVSIVEKVASALESLVGMTDCEPFAEFVVNLADGHTDAQAFHHALQESGADLGGEGPVNELFTLIRTSNWATRRRALRTKGELAGSGPAGVDTVVSIASGSGSRAVVAESTPPSGPFQRPGAASPVPAAVPSSFPSAPPSPVSASTATAAPAYDAAACDRSSMDSCAGQGKGPPSSMARGGGGVPFLLHI